MSNEPNKADQLPQSTDAEFDREVLPLTSFYSREQILFSLNDIANAPMFGDATKARKLAEIEIRVLLDIRDLLLKASPYDVQNQVVENLAEAAKQ